MASSRTMELTLISAKDLKDVNIFSKMEVYAVASIDGDPRTQQRTPADRNGGPSPSWNHSLRLPIPSGDPSRHALVVLLRSERALGDRDVGEIRIPLSEILSGAATGGPQYLSYQVRKPSSGKPKGVLNLSFKVSDPIPVANKPPKGATDLGSAYAPAYPPPAAAAYPPPAKASKADEPVTAYPPTKTSKVDEPVTAYPVAGPSAGASYPPPGASAPYPPPGGHPGYPPQYGYPGAPPPAGYGYPPPQAGYGYQPQAGYGYGAPPVAAAQKPKKNKFGMGLGAGLLGGALGGMLLGDMVSDASAYDAGYDGGFDDAGGFDF